MSRRYVKHLQLYFLIWYYFIKLVQTSGHYENLVVLIDSDECSGQRTKEIRFNTDVAINLTLPRLNYHHYTSWDDIKCHYRLQPVDGHNGIFATIQELALYTGEKKCSSFVQFITSQGRKSKEFCGTLSAKQIMNLQQESFDTQSNSNTFVSANGGMDIYIFIPKEVIKSDKNVKINIIFTLFEYCVKTPEMYKSCLERREFCIHENFFYDGVINCPFYGCVDEGGCVKSQPVANELLVGSITSIVVFTMFILFFYICWKHNKCYCCKQINPNDTNAAQMTRVVELDDTTNEFQNMNVRAQTLNENEDKDLPPTYESLFPSR